MKKIEIQNCTDFKDKFFKLIVNGEKHTIPYQFLTIHIDDDKPFKIKAKYFWNFSQVYTFEPKENMLLQILINRRMMRWSRVGNGVLVVMTMMIMKYFEYSLYAVCMVFFVCAVLGVFINKNYFVIKEVNTEIFN